MSKDLVEQLAKDLGGKVESMERLPDGSGAAVVSFALPKTHWIYGDKSREGKHGFEAPPMPFRMGVRDLTTVRVNMTRCDTLDRKQMGDNIRLAAQYAVRAATMKGTEMDFDPDALVQNMITGLLGYFTDDGLCEDDWANPPQFRKS
jgi:hypothetical protein